MRERHAAVSEAEEALERWHGLTVRLARLRSLTRALEVAQEALERAAVPAVPSGERLDEPGGGWPGSGAPYGS